MPDNVINSAEWGTHSIQLIAFPADPMAGMTQEWFTAITGEVPEVTKTRIRREDQAEVQGRLLSLTCEISKIVWAEHAVFKVDEPPSEMPSIGVFAEVRERFTKLIAGWWAVCPPIWRLGFASKIVIPTSGREDSYERLSKCLADSVKIDTKNSSDFNYRINRPRQSKVLPDRKVNRLVTWSAFRIELGLQSSASPQGAPLMRIAVHSCSADLDINTTQENTEPIPLDNLPSLWEELKGMGAEIAERGDVE